MSFSPFPHKDEQFWHIVGKKASSSFVVPLGGRPQLSVVVADGARAREMSSSLSPASAPPIRGCWKHRKEAGERRGQDARASTIRGLGAAKDERGCNHHY